MDTRSKRRKPSRPEPLSDEMRAWEMEQVRELGLDDVPWDHEKECPLCTGRSHLGPAVDSSDGERFVHHLPPDRDPSTAGAPKPAPAPAAKARTIGRRGIPRRPMRRRIQR